MHFLESNHETPSNPILTHRIVSNIHMYSNIIVSLTHQAEEKKKQDELASALDALMDFEEEDKQLEGMFFDTQSMKRWFVSYVYTYTDI